MSEESKGEVGEVFGCGIWIFASAFWCIFRGGRKHYLDNIFADPQV